MAKKKGQQGIVFNPITNQFDQVVGNRESFPYYKTGADSGDIEVHYGQFWRVDRLFIEEGATLTIKDGARVIVGDY